MRLFLFFILVSIISSCNQNPSVGNEIVFGDAIGSYQGRCASYDADPQVVENEEDANLSVFALNLEEVGVNPSCDYFEDFQLRVTVANSSQIRFVKQASTGSEVNMTYFSEKDSISLTQECEGGDNIIFTGIRQ